ncbi:MAG TPA: methyltransferase domain-containing protein [Candidatus Latescibacteria bacterium]|nr:methyltransferase domain-containing protein [Candidatus Latescibacterota bacterium]
MSVAPHSSTAYFARSNRGLEWVAAAEISGRLGAPVTAIRHRQIHFELPSPDPALLDLRTVDDVFISCGTVTDIDHTRASLPLLTDKALSLDLAGAMARLANFRAVGSADPFDAVASFLGRRNYNRFEIEEALGRAVARQLGGEQQSHRDRSRAQISWRIHLGENEALVGLRIAPVPLHRRSYKGAAPPGTLHPPVAAAMALIAGLRPYGLLLDPCCGAGTIGIEAAGLQPELHPLLSDLRPRAVRMTRDNARAAARSIHLAVADAGQLSLGHRAVDRIVCNPPWNRTVEAGGFLRHDTAPLWREAARVLHSEGRAVILCEEVEPSQLTRTGLNIALSCRIRLLGRWANLSVLLPESHDDPAALDPYGLLGAELLTAWQARTAQ